MRSLIEKDLQEIAERFPDLNSSIRKQRIWGTLRFACSYSSVMNQLSYSGEFECFIKEDYEIEIDFSRQDSNGVPFVFERSQIVRSFAISNNIKLPDLHIYEDDSCCLGIFPEYQWQGAVHFIQYKVIPFFYWQSFRRMYGREPWKTLSHGILGVAEASRYFQLNKKNAFKGCNRNQPCFCGSGKKSKHCCGKFSGI